ncbi:MAG: SPFH domain-containing protein, partial [Ruthenibacterium sp.]
MIYVFIALLIIVAIIVVTNICVVPQATQYVVERLGIYYKSWSAGLHFKVPFIDRVSKKVSLKEQVVDFQPQPVIT